jgi:hypothetical protein
MFKLLSTANPKIQKGTKLGYLSFILHLAPADLSGKNTCPKATAGCKAACLNTAGRGGMFRKGENTNMIQKARIRKTEYFFNDRDAFMMDLYKDIQKGIKMAEKLDLIPVFRLNGTSDLSWEKYTVGSTDMNLFQLFPTVQFYDYTKVLGRKVSQYFNYFLIFSKADGNDADVSRAMAQGMNVAAVFDAIPESYNGRDVINADETDLRFLDPKGVIAGLKAKGKAKKDYSGFVIRLKELA